MGSRSKRVDREKHEVDIIEHVIEGVRAEEDTRGADRTQEANVDVRPWLGGHVVSAVQVRVMPDADDKRRSRRRRDDK